MDKKLFFSAILKFLFGVLLVGILVFLPAGTLSFVNGWLFFIILFVPMLVVGLVMMLKNPALLKSRLNAKEKRKEQGLVIKLSGLMFVLGFVLAGLDFRFGWFDLPFGVSVAAAVVFCIAYALYAEVLRENRYLSRTIEVREGQRVVDTGLYSVVRHPMYFTTLLLFCSMPLVLGSLISLPVFLMYPFLVVKRIKGEERFLSENLPGYVEYQKKVKYRLLPFIW